MKHFENLSLFSGGDPEKGHNFRYYYDKQGPVTCCFSRKKTMACCKQVVVGTFMNAVGGKKPKWEYGVQMAVMESGKHRVVTV